MILINETCCPINTISCPYSGKTTVTERILYESGKIRSAGNIRHGTTTTDFLECEQQRGITVNSAFVQTEWGDNIINIIDTPGHIDFNFEVERSVRVLDGALVVIDGTRGVEPQTITVWRQLQKFGVPGIIFLNKLDRDRRNLNVCMSSISAYLDTVPVIVNQPVFDENNVLIGVNDNYSQETLTEIIECIAGIDEEMEYLYFSHECEISKISRSEIMDCIVRLHKNGKVTPICHGSGITGVGIASCLDSITAFLPSPEEVKSKLPIDLQSSVCGVVFKSSLDPNKGVLCQSRLYSGILKRRSRLLNTRTGTVAQASSLFQISADMISVQESCKAGEIIMFSGCKDFRTGDVFVDASWDSNKDKLAKLIASNAVLKSTVTFGKPLFFCTIECEHSYNQDQLEKALDAMTFEDPTLTLQKGSFGEFELGGNGQLHLSIVRDRLKNEYGLKCKAYKFRVNYFETVLEEMEHSFSDDCGEVVVKVQTARDEGRVVVTGAHPKVREVVETTTASCLAIGPLLGLQIANCNVTVALDAAENFDVTTVTVAKKQAIANLVRSGVRETFHENLSQVVLSEPFADVEVEGPYAFSFPVTADFSSRIGSSDYELKYQESEKWFNMVGRAPLSKLVDYVSHIRRISSGQASVVKIEMTHYSAMEQEESRCCVEKLQYGQF